MRPEPRPPKAEAVTDRDRGASAGRALAVTGVYVASAVTVGTTACVGALRYYVGGLAAVPLWTVLGGVALVAGTWAAIWLARH